MSARGEKVDGRESQWKQGDQAMFSRKVSRWDSPDIVTAGRWDQKAR